MKSKKVKKLKLIQVSQKKSPIKIKISKFLLVEFSRHSNSQIYFENSLKDVLYFLLFFPEESADCKNGVVPSRKCKQNGNSFQRKNADV